MHESERRVVVTGIGIVSPIGIGVDPFWASLSSLKSGIAPVDMLSYSGCPGNIGGEVKDFTDEAAKKVYLKDQRKNLKVMCREIQLGAASANLSLADAKIDPATLTSERFGVDFGANLMFSPPEVLADAARECTPDVMLETPFLYDLWGPKGLPSMEPLWLLRYLPNMPACHIGISAQARGPSNSITLAEASGNLALAEATHVIQRDRAEVMIAGTTGTRLHAVKSMHAALYDTLGHHEGDPPATWSRPFDKSRNGQILAEGACSLILEEESFARGRGATIYATVLGAGSSCVIRRDGTPDRRQALVNAMQAALRDANLSPADIGHINAHGLSEIECDAEEAAAIHDVFGPLATQVPVTALKSYFGNSGASCGTMELAGSLVALRHGIVPATLNYTTPDPSCTLNVVHGAARPATNKVFMKLSVTRMGQASVSILRGE